MNRYDDERGQLEVWIDLWDGCISSHAFTKLDDFLLGRSGVRNFVNLVIWVWLLESSEREVERWIARYVYG